LANQVSSVDVPLSLFSGWNTELSPPDQPEGASPANNDVVFTPGSVATRPGVNRVFAAPVSSLGPFSYQKSFVTPSGVVQNLYLTKGDGILWVEYLATNPGVAVSLFNFAGATYASSCTAQGREYIMLSDGVHGVDIPLQWDGVNLYRVTQDGPGASPTVQSIPLPPSSMAVSGTTTYAISSAVAILPYVVGGTTYYQQIQCMLTVPGAPIGVGESVSYLSLDYNVGSPVVSLIYSGSVVTGFTIYYFGTTAGPDAGGSATIGGASLVRSANTVTATTATDHGLKVGYQVQISNAGVSTIGSGITSIVLNNEDNPGIATVTMAEPHGLLPQNQVVILGVPSTTAGTAITNVAFAGGLVTITTSTAHGLSIGSEVLIAAVTNTSVNGQWSVATIPSTTTFTYLFASGATPYSAADTGTVSYIWPLASTDPAENTFTVQTAPTPTTFTIQLSYTDGTWGPGGVVQFAWDGIFFVTGVLSPTQFQYQQYGPSATVTTIGLVTPYGQAAPGIHQLQMSWLFESGDISFPSPPVTFVANGGQYLQISGMAVPSTNDVVGRILQFTGSGGAYFYYIPTPAQVNGLIVSTATQINDITSTSVLLDFSDNTLYEATNVTKPGNNLSNVLTLGAASGVFTYASRLAVWGFRNKVQNLLNMNFAGGTLLSNGLPLGWNTSLCVDGLLSSCRLQIGSGNDLCAGFLVQVHNDGAKYGLISQSAYADAAGAPIVLPNTFYSIRIWMAAGSGDPNLDFFATLSSASTGFVSTAIMNGILMPVGSGTNPTGGYLEAPFAFAMPSTIPADMTLTYWLRSTSTTTPVITFLYNETEVFYTEQKYIDNEEWISYADNLSSFDDQTGIFGPEDDLSPIRNHGVIRQSLYIVTGTGLHETEDNGQTEPSGWTVNQVADNCGAFSIASVARNPQGIGSAGKDWMMWCGPDGAQIFTGQKPYKISQEIQSVWDAIPAANAYQCWVKNYENAKWCFFGTPTAGGSMQVLVLDYRNIDGEAIAANPPIHISFTGKMIVSDLTRKWTTWTLPAWCGELMYRNTIAQPQIVFGCETPSGGANSYIVNANQYHDDDFGLIPASYTTYFFVSHEMEQALQVGSHRHVYTLAQAFISGVGTWTLTPLAASLNNPFPPSPSFPLNSDPGYDIDFGINVTTTRCAFMIQAAPISGLDSYFKLQKLVINMAKDPNAPTRGTAGGSF
jgi:hypothetical protein